MGRLYLDNFFSSHKSKSSLSIVFCPQIHDNELDDVLLYPLYYRLCCI